MSNENISSNPNQWIVEHLRLILSTLITITLLASIFKSLIRWLIFAKRINKLPGIPVPSLKFYLGNLNMIYLIKHQMNIVDVYFIYLRAMTRLFDKTFRLWLSVMPVVIVHRADSAERILSSNMVIEKSMEYSMLQTWLNEGLLTSGGNKWRHRSILDHFLTIMNEHANVLINIINERIKQGTECLDIVPLITNAALDVIAETAMGVKIDSQRAKNDQYVQTLSRVSKTIVKRFLMPWLRINFIYFNFFPEGRRHQVDIRFMHSFTMNVIRERKSKILAQMERNGKEQNPENYENKRKRLAFMDLLIEQHLKSPKDFTEVNIREEVDTFMFEGHDTTAMSIIWTLYLIGNYPEIQARIHEEIEKLYYPGEGKIMWTKDQLSQMKFLEACIKESLRLFPSVPFIGRQAKEDLEIEDGVIIPKNSTILLFLYEIQQDPKYFPEPTRFIPDRFIEGSEHYGGKINPFAFVPFSAGPRNCIGQKFALQEEKIILASIFSQFKIRSMLADREAMIQPELILRPRSTLFISFQPK